MYVDIYLYGNSTGGNEQNNNLKCSLIWLFRLQFIVDHLQQIKFDKSQRLLM